MEAKVIPKRTDVDVTLDATGSPYTNDVADDLVDELKGTLATRVKTVGSTIRVYCSCEADADDQWEIHRAGIDTLHDWGFHSLDTDRRATPKPGEEHVSTFRLE